MNPTIYRSGDFLTTELRGGRTNTVWVRSAGLGKNPNGLLLTSADDYTEPWDYPPPHSRHATADEASRFRAEHNAWRIRRDLTPLH